MDLKKLIAVARGDSPADLLFTNGRVVNTFTGEIEEANVAVAEGRIAGVGDYGKGESVISLGGKYLAPGLIDGHFHLESIYLDVCQYARAVVPHGCLAGVTDLHEIANVCGLSGLRYVQNAARELPFDLLLMAPSCVPATRLETSGAKFGSREIQQVFREAGAIGLGEFMDFPAVIRGDDGALSRLAASGQKLKDGHAPGLRGHDLNAYLAPGIGSDHESTRYDEGLEKLRRGMYLMIREGSSERNLEELLPLVTDKTYHRCMLVTDDRNAKDLLYDGGVDALVRKAVHLGLDPVRAFQLATIVPATYFHLNGLGAIAPRYWANLLVLSDLSNLTVESVYYRGRLVAHDRRPLFDVPATAMPVGPSSMNVKTFTVYDLRQTRTSDTIPVIEVIPGQITTRWLEERAPTDGTTLVADPARDLVKVVVVERHKATGNIAKGLVKGLGMQHGALATSFAHDSHNIVAVGMSDEDIYTAIKSIESMGGGLVAVDQGVVCASLGLPIAGLMTDQSLEQVVERLDEVELAARRMGCHIPSPFSVLSFLALPVVPELKITDLGLVDVVKGELVGQGD